MRWLLDHWYIPLFFIFVIVGAIVARKQWAAAMASLDHELDVIKAGADARKLAAEANHSVVIQTIEAQHQQVIAKLDAEQKAEAERLRDDPPSLARFLVRVGGSP